MGGGMKKAITKIKKTKAWDCYRNTEIVTTSESQCFMTVVGKGSEEVQIPCLG